MKENGNRLLDVRKNAKGKKIMILIFSLLLLIIGGMFLYDHFQSQYMKKIEIEKTERLEKIKASYNEYVITNKECLLYDVNGNEIGNVTKGMYLVLDTISDNYDKEYFKLRFSDLYIKYTDIVKTEEIKGNNRYDNYIPFNRSAIINEKVKLYVDENTYYVIDNEEKRPIIIDDEDKYYITFDNKLVYIYKNECNVVEELNSSDEIANDVSVLNYHFVINIEAGEDKLCEPSSICHTDTQFDSHMKYISENGFYTITMKELEMFIDGKINLPKKSVAITIDDGWFVYRVIPILEKYNVMGTLFLIGSLAPVSDYASDNLELHSHTWDLHNISECSEGRSALLCYDKNRLVEDLKKSRENLNNTTYFCYPFYEYNGHAIEALKEAGFTMALKGGNSKVTKNVNKFKVPRYVIYNTTTVNGLAQILT